MTALVLFSRMFCLLSLRKQAEIDRMFLLIGKLPAHLVGLQPTMLLKRNEIIERKFRDFSI